MKSGLLVRHIDGPHFVASKLEAFESRGDRDFVMSHDLEDLVRVVDGRLGIEEELALAPRELREFVSIGLANCLQDAYFVEALPGYFSAGDEGRGRAWIVLERLRRIARSVKPEGRA